MEKEGIIAVFKDDIFKDNLTEIQNLDQIPKQDNGNGENTELTSNDEVFQKQDN